MKPQTLARCSISIRGPPTLSLSAAGYDFHMTVHYHGLTTEGPEHVVCDTRRGILHPKSPNRGYCSIYTVPNCTAESRVPFKPANVSMRRPRDPTGRLYPTRRLRV
jgi:hypothetical protein